MGYRISLTLLAAILLLVGCNNIDVILHKTGKTYPALSEGCPVRFENLTPQEASVAEYEQVGILTVSGLKKDQLQAVQVWDGAVKERLWPKVCELGGSIVTLVAMGGGESDSLFGKATGHAQFLVWREKGQ